MIIFNGQQRPQRVLTQHEIDWRKEQRLKKKAKKARAICRKIDATFDRLDAMDMQGRINAIGAQLSRGESWEVCLGSDVFVRAFKSEVGGYVVAFYQGERKLSEQRFASSRVAAAYYYTHATMRSK